MTKSEKKAAAKKLLKLFGPKGEHWTTKQFARDAKGKTVDYDSPQAAKWCLLGACDKFRLGGYWLSDAIKKKMGMKCGEYAGWIEVANFNDADGFPSVRDFLQKIAKGEL